MKIEKSTESLYHRYPQQQQPQSAYIQLDPNTESLSAHWDGEIGNAVPPSVWHGQILRFDISPELLPEAINELMAEIKDLAQVVCEGHTVVWDGNNHVGRLNEAAKNAKLDIIGKIDDLELYPDQDETYAVWDCGDFLECARGKVETLIESGKTREEMEEIIYKWGEEAEGEVILEGVDEYLDELFDAE